MIGTAQRRSTAPGRQSVWGVAAGAGLFAAMVAPLLALRFHPHQYPIDLDVYREAGRFALHHRDPYAAGFGSALRIPLPFTYPPFAALAMIPLALAPKPALMIGWTALTVGLLVAIALLAVKPALDRRGLGHPVVFALACGILVWTLPVAQTISYGQVNLILALACLLDCTSTTKRRGVLVGLATAVKLTPGIFVVYFAITRQWAAAVRAAATAAVCGLLGLIVYPRPSREYWLHLVFDTKRPGSPAYYGDQSLFAALERLNITWVWFPLALVLGAAGLWRARRAHQAGAEVAAVALVGLTAVVVSPISWQHHGVWIVLAAGVLVAWATTVPRALVAAGTMGVFLLPLDYWGQRLLTAGATAPWLTMLLRNSYAIAFIGLLLALPLPHREEPEQALPASGLAWR